MPAEYDDILLPFRLPSVCKKKVTAAFDGGTISSDGGVFLLAGADRRIGLIDRLAALFPDTRDPAQVTHSMADLLRERVFAIACGYPDGNDLDDLRADPAFKMAFDRTSCRSPRANQMRLILHTAAYWLVRTVRDAIPKHEPLASGEFSTIRLRLLKIAVRVRETASRIRLGFAAHCPNAALFRDLIGALMPRAG